MNIFHRLKTLTNEQECSGVDIADALLELMYSLGGGDFSKPEFIEAQKILDESAKRHNGLYDIQEVLSLAVNLIGEPKTSKERRVLASVYCASHTEYTLYAIKAMEDYIANGLDYESLRDIDKPGMTHEMLEKEYTANMYAQLGKLYERTYDFDKALECYKKQAAYDTWSHFPYLNISELYRKKNEPDKSIAILEEAKCHPSYKKNIVKFSPDDLFYSDVIDKFLKEAKARKRKNYVYKPKGHKKFIEITD